MRLSAKHDPNINVLWTTFLIHSTYLPLGIGLGVIIEPLEVEEANTECVLLVKGYGVINPVFI